jgi:hypothetical protein
MRSSIQIEFTPVTGWGDQVGWVTVRPFGAVPGLILNRLPVFRQGPGRFSFGSSAVPGALPGSGYSVVVFSADRHRQRFHAQLDDAVRRAHPELFQSEGQR